MENLKEIMMIITEGCNLACSYCFENHKSNKKMTFDVAKKIIDYEMQLDDGSTEYRFTMFGGEPTLEFALIKQIHAYIADNIQKWNKKIMMFIDTNGTLLTEEMKNWLRLNKQTVYCGLSLDGTKEMHDINRSNSFDNIDLEFYKECWPKQTVKMTVSAQTLHKLAEGVIYIHELGYECGCTFAYGIEWNQEMLSELKEQLRILEEYYLEHKDINLCQILNIDLTGILLKPEKKYKRCSSGKYVKAYDTEGNLYPCHTFSPVALGEEAEKFINYTLPVEDIVENEKCVNCRYHILCPTCYGANYIYSGDVGKRNDKLCELFELCIQTSARIQFNRIKEKEVDALDQKDYLLLSAIDKIFN